MPMKDIPFGITQISPQQIRLRSLFSVQRILAARGFRVISEGSFRDTLLARDRWSREEFQLAFEIFSNPKWRQELLRTVENAICVPTTAEVSKFVSLPDFQPERQRYSTTFAGCFLGQCRWSICSHTPGENDRLTVAANGRRHASLSGCSTRAIT
jgi:hypothetical protein